MKITRMLQTTYWLEPAGSHGAQGLDDYHFAVFSAPLPTPRARPLLTPQAVFGSSQLRDRKSVV